MVPIRTGNLWLNQWQQPYSEEPPIFHVHAPDGRQIARITLPARARLSAILDGEVLLIRQDSLDVQYVERYEIVR